MLNEVLMVKVFQLEISWTKVWIRSLIRSLQDSKQYYIRRNRTNHFLVRSSWMCFSRSRNTSAMRQSHLQSILHNYRNTLITITTHKYQPISLQSTWIKPVSWKPVGIAGRRYFADGMPFLTSKLKNKAKPTSLLTENYSFHYLKVYLTITVRYIIKLK